MRKVFNGKILFLIILMGIAMGIYAIFFGLPWKAASYKKEFEAYLENKYAIDFQMEKVNFDFMHLSYSSHAYPVEDPTLVFYVGQDIQTKEFHDLYEYEVEKRRSGRK